MFLFVCLFVCLFKGRRQLGVEMYGRRDSRIAVRAGDSEKGRGRSPLLSPPLCLSALLGAGRRRQSLSKVLKVGALPSTLRSEAPAAHDLLPTIDDRTAIDLSVLSRTLVNFANHLDSDRWMYTRNMQQDRRRGCCCRCCCLELDCFDGNY